MTGAGRTRVIALTLVTAGAALAAGAPGTLDTDFGTGGVASVAMPFQPGVYSTVYRDGIRQSGGRIILGGSQTGAQHAWHLVALDSSGAPDLTFGSSGQVMAFSNAVNGQMSDASVDGQDRILLGGSLSFLVTQGRKTKTVGGLAVARFTASGVLDTTFGSGGLVHDALSDFTGLSGWRAQQVATQTDGKIVVAGDVVKVKGTSYTNYACLLVRYLSNGQRDAAFGIGGVVIDDLNSAGGTEGAYSVAIDSEGRLIVRAYNNTIGHVISRYQASGALDAAFGSAGRIFPALSVRSVAVDGQDRILACGSDTAQTQGVVIRYTEAGVPDPAFGMTGVLVDPGVDLFFEAAVESSGDLLLTGSRDAGIRSITRVLASGTVDIAFGTSGHAEGPVVSTTGGQCPVLVGPTTVAFSMGAPSGTYGSPWYVTQFHR